VVDRQTDQRPVLGPETRPEKARGKLIEVARALAGALPQEDADEAQRDLESWDAPAHIVEALRKRTDMTINVERENWATVIIFRDCELDRHVVGLSTFARATVKFYLSGLPALEVRTVCEAWREQLADYPEDAARFRYDARMLGDCRTMASAFAAVHNAAAR
jgi:hypothetical protein